MNKHTKVKTAICLVLIILSLGILFAQSKIQILPGLLSLRQQERQQLLGPCHIQDTLTLPMLLYDRITIGTSEHGYTLYYWNEELLYAGDHLVYYPKSEEMILSYGVLNDLIPYMEGWQYPIFLFSERPNAVKAQLELAMTVDGETEIYRLEATRQYDCLFLFCLNGELMTREAFLNYMDRSSSDSTITLTLYDRSGAALETLVKD